MERKKRKKGGYGAGLSSSLAALWWRKKEQISAEEKASSRLELLEGAATSVAAGRRKKPEGKGEWPVSVFLRRRRWRGKKKRREATVLVCLPSTAVVRRMTDWEGLLCLGGKEQENGAGLREEENAGTGWRGREAEGKWRRKKKMVGY